MEKTKLREEVKIRISRLEFVIAIAIAGLLIASLLSQKYFRLPFQVTSVLILAFIAIKIFNIIHEKGKVFEEFVSLAALAIFWVIHFLKGDRLNPIIILTVIFMLLYSIGLLYWVRKLFKSRNILAFILSYVVFVFFIIFLFAGAYETDESLFLVQGHENNISINDALYFSTITFTTVGYGDITPLGTNRGIAGIEALTGMVLNIVYVGYIMSSGRFKKEQRLDLGQINGAIKENIINKLNGKEIKK
jgi:hypothetical protein